MVDACATSDRAEARLGAPPRRQRYPGDPSVAATLLLNLVVLEPGQALRLDAGNLHAYLAAPAIELMGASDNVVRGGLTVKPVDVDELLRIVDPTPLAEPVLAEATVDCRLDDDVQLVRLEAGDIHRAVGHEVSIDLDGARRAYLAPGDERLVDRRHLRRHQLTSSARRCQP